MITSVIFTNCESLSASYMYIYYGMTSFKDQICFISLSYYMIQVFPILVYSMISVSGFDQWISLTSLITWSKLYGFGLSTLSHLLYSQSFMISKLWLQSNPLVVIRCGAMTTLIVDFLWSLSGVCSSFFNPLDCSFVSVIGIMTTMTTILANKIAYSQSTFIVHYVFSLEL